MTYVSAVGGRFADTMVSDRPGSASTTSKMLRIGSPAASGGSDGSSCCGDRRPRLSSRS
jgi:hypothetical protein